MLRHAKCPVMLLKRDEVTTPSTVLLAINPKVEDAKHKQLNEDILELAHFIRDNYEAVDLHAVSAYTGSEAFTHPPELAALVGIDDDHAHCTPGNPGDVIVDCAGLLKAELVVIGTVSRSGLSGLAKPNTAEQALDRLGCDLLVMVAPD